jgi:hypothetical protein
MKFAASEYSDAWQFPGALLGVTPEEKMNLASLWPTAYLVFLLGLCPTLVCQAAPAGKDLRQFLTPDGRLQSSLVLREAQQGFAGVSGEVWTIEPDGRFSITRFLNEKIDAPYWTRKLSAAERKGLARVLAASRFFELPDSLGSASVVNPQLLTMTFAKKQCTLALVAGQVVTRETVPPPGDPQLREWRNFIAIVLAIHDLAKNRRGAE